MVKYLPYLKQGLKYLNVGAFLLALVFAGRMSVKSSPPPIPPAPIPSPMPAPIPQPTPMPPQAKQFNTATRPGQVHYFLVKPCDANH